MDYCDTAMCLSITVDCTECEKCFPNLYSFCSNSEEESKGLSCTDIIATYLKKKCEEK